MSTAISGLNTTLYCGDSATALTKLCDIKDVPDLISEPNLLDATTLSDPMQVNIFGIIMAQVLVPCLVRQRLMRLQEGQGGWL